MPDGWEESIKLVPHESREPILVFRCRPQRAGICWKDAGVLQEIEARVGLGRGGTRAALGTSAVVVLSLLTWCVKKPPEPGGYGTPCLSTSPEEWQPSRHSGSTSTEAT